MSKSQYSISGIVSYPILTFCMILAGYKDYMCLSSRRRAVTYCAWRISTFIFFPSNWWP